MHAETFAKAYMLAEANRQSVRREVPSTANHKHKTFPMIYSNTEELVALLKRENLWAQKRLGQNFLVNMQALNNITRAAELSKQDHVLEIGPGLGILTEQLCRQAGTVTAIELDDAIIPALKKNLGGNTNIEIIRQDALQTQLPDHPYKLVANIPYYITSPILNHFLQPHTPEQLRPSLIVLLVQKEVAQKICAGDGDQSVLSLQVQAFGKPEIVCLVGKNSFFPQPKVDSAVLKIVTFPTPRIGNTKTFFHLIKTAFGQKRKTLANSLKELLASNGENAGDLLKKAGIDDKRRPQTLSLEEWQKLVELFPDDPKGTN